MKEAAHPAEAAETQSKGACQLAGGVTVYMPGRYTEMISSADI